MSNKPTAAETYAAHMAQAEALVQQLGVILDNHKAIQAQSPKSWGYPGELRCFVENLRNASQILLP
jgi:hypothetical protein